VSFIDPQITRSEGVAGVLRKFIRCHLNSAATIATIPAPPSA
jgi:hypothetical protein